MTYAILLIKITAIAFVLASLSLMALSGVDGAPAAAATPSIPVAAIDATVISGATACVCRYADGWERLAHCGDCNTQEILTGACYTRGASGTSCA
ncbi:hypothetical protein BGX24_012363 [Mortierella sp. AD032]|nr:hypothetical protein BGX24_012363 [Mortierella sp. AD032]